MTNLAARLCGEAEPGQILIPRRAIKDLVDVEPVGALTRKEFHRPVSACNVLRLKE